MKLNKTLNISSLSFNLNTDIAIDTDIQIVALSYISIRTIWKN